MEDESKELIQVGSFGWELQQVELEVVRSPLTGSTTAIGIRNWKEKKSFQADMHGNLFISKEYDYLHLNACPVINLHEEMLLNLFLLAII